MTCCVLLELQLLDIMIVQFRKEKVSNHGSIPITIDCNVVAFIVFEDGFHQPIKRTKQSVFLDDSRNNRRRATTPFVKLVARVEKWEALDPPPGVLPQNWVGTELYCTVTCIELKATASDMRTSSPSIFTLRPIGPF
ncbi:hypothetical protein TNCV_4172361 [Trichonephila clavipes]|nr:hypothetical protein TNCV_4172361 [Trichonephila clavipes]